MDITPSIISYRSQYDHSSHFLNVDKLLQSRNPEKIKKIYMDIFRSVTAYDPDHVESLIKVEKKIYSRIVQLKNEKNENLRHKNIGWKGFGLSILSLGVRPLILYIRETRIEGEIKEMRKLHRKFTRALSQMQQRHLEKELFPKPAEILELESKRLENLNAEVARLNSIPRIAKSLQTVNKKLPLTAKYKVALGHSLELREKLKETHYVINHGQNLDLMLVNVLSRKIKEEFEPTHYTSFEPLRHNTALRHIKEDTHTTAWYKEQLNKKWATDHSYRKQLLSGDCVLESTIVSESAIVFFANTKNVAKKYNPSLIHDLFESIVRDYITDQDVVEKLCNDLIKIASQCPRGGNLYSICIPKEKFDESCYFSKPYGVPLANQAGLKEKLDLMQSGEYPNGNPQVRVLTHKIRPEDGYHVIVNSTFTNEQLSKIEEEISLIIQAALTGYRVKKNPKNLKLSS